MTRADSLSLSHSAIVKRLERADGHLLWSSRRERAIAQAKKTLIHDHLDHCLADATARPDPTNPSQIDEFRALAKYL